MNKSPKDYTIDQAFNDIIYLGTRLKLLEEVLVEWAHNVNKELSEWTEFITTELLRHEVSKEHKTYFLNRIKEKMKGWEEDSKGQKKYIFDMGEDVAKHSKEIQKLFESRKTKGNYTIK